MSTVRRENNYCYRFGFIAIILRLVNVRRSWGHIHEVRKERRVHDEMFYVPLGNRISTSGPLSYPNRGKSTIVKAYQDLKGSREKKSGRSVEFRTRESMIPTKMEFEE